MKQKSAENGIKVQIVSPLLDWFADNARKLPWREDAHPYYVWISEIMLQQTRVMAVKEYFARFVRELPDIEALANVTEERLLKLWEGLGYYSRAKNLKKAAVIVMEEYNGKLPEKTEELLKLPGIGAYTAGAIASIAYNQVAAAVDGNVLRVITRLLGDFSDIGRESVRRDFEKQLLRVMPRDFPGAFNQALMELGALVCVPNGKPHCTECPVMDFCAAYKENFWDKLPVFLIEGEKGFFVRRRKESGLLSGLWEYPSVQGIKTEEEVRTMFCDNVAKIQPLGAAKHIFSHIEWRMFGYYIRLRQFSPQSEKICFQKEGEHGIMSSDIIPSASSRPTKGRTVSLANCAHPSERSMFGEHGIMSLCIPVTFEKLRAEYSIPAAFSAYQKAVEKLREQ